MTSPDPLFRAPKGTANYNAYKTLSAGVVGALAILLLTDPALRLWDTALRGRPWIDSTLTLRPGPSGPLVEDRTAATYPVSGERRVWVEGADGLRFCDGERNDGWEGTSDRIWTFHAFTEGCEAPAVPFRVCTSFVVQTPRGARGSFGPFCSAFDPTGPR